MTTPFQTLTTGIIALLTGAGLLVGDGITPNGAGWQGVPKQSNFVPYCVVHPLLGGISDGSIGDPHGDSEVVYQVSCYGGDRLSCEAMANRVHSTLLGATRPTVTGQTVKHVDDDVLGGARREDDLQPPLWMAVPRYRFFVTPSA